MRMRSIFLFIGLLVFLTGSFAQAQNILLWQNYGQATLISPETGVEITPDFDLKLALAANMRYFDTEDVLPEDLSPYDIIFITLGFAMDCG